MKTIKDTSGSFDMMEANFNALADVSGKGLRGAMSAVLTNGMLHEVVQLESKARAILSRLNTESQA